MRRDRLRHLDRIYAHVDDERLAQMFGVRVETIQRYARQNRLRKARPVEGPRRKWTPMQLEYLRSLYPSLGSIETGYVLGRSAAAVRKKAHQLGLSIQPELRTLMCRRAAESRCWYQQNPMPGSEAARCVVLSDGDE